MHRCQTILGVTGVAAWDRHFSSRVVANTCCNSSYLSNDTKNVCRICASWQVYRRGYKLRLYSSSRRFPLLKYCVLYKARLAFNSDNGHPFCFFQATDNSRPSYFYQEWGWQSQLTHLIVIRWVCSQQQAQQAHIDFNPTDKALVSPHEDTKAMYWLLSSVRVRQ